MWNKKNILIQRSLQRLKAFTLIELLIVIGIVVTISIVGFGDFSGQRDTRVLALETEKITTVLRATQQSSITQEDGAQWGVRFTNASSGADYYEIFAGVSYSAGTVRKKAVLNSDVAFSNPAEGAFTDIIFNPKSGTLISSSSVDLVSIRKTSLTNSIVVSALGLVSVVSTSTTSLSPPPPPVPPLIVYDDVLQSPWLNASWGSYIDFSNTSPIAPQGVFSINASSTAGWSALRLRNGPWGGGIPVNFTGKNYMQFIAYGYISGTPLRVSFANDGGDSFPGLCFIGANSIPSGTWTTYSIPLSGLNPSGLTVHSITFQIWTAIKQKWFIDDIKLSPDIIPGTPVGSPC